MNVTILSSFNPTQLTGLRVSKVESCHVMLIIQSLLVIPCFSNRFEGLAKKCI